MSKTLKRFRLRARQHSKQWQVRLTELELRASWQSYPEPEFHFRTVSTNLEADGTLVAVVEFSTTKPKQKYFNNVGMWVFRYKTDNKDVKAIKLILTGEHEGEYTLPVNTGLRYDF